MKTQLAELLKTSLLVIQANRMAVQSVALQTVCAQVVLAEPVV